MIWFRLVFSKWTNQKYHIKKVKAHENIKPDEKFQEAWVKLGNCIADEVAKAVVARENDLVKKMALEIKNHNIQQVRDLQKVYAYLIAFNKASMLAKKMDDLQKDVQTSVAQDEQQEDRRENQHGNDKKSAVKILYTWKVDNPSPYPNLILDKEIAGCVLLGGKSSKWSPGMVQNIKMAPKGDSFERWFWHKHTWNCL